MSSITPELRLAFDKIDIRVGVIRTAYIHPDAEKLLVESISIGEEKERQIISGIASFYKPIDLENTKCLVLSNAKPSKLRGLMSEGMILCAFKEEVVREESGEEGGGLVEKKVTSAVEIVRPHDNAAVGSRISLPKAVSDIAATANLSSSNAEVTSLKDLINLKKKGNPWEIVSDLHRIIIDFHSFTWPSL